MDEPPYGPKGAREVFFYLWDEPGWSRLSRNQKGDLCFTEQQQPLGFCALELFFR